ncbi:FUSC family protein [Clavibacter zhangzhiyongii]|uniref:FUSC family protein n=1 Tax=Clavibacter zhangzhiyongii TaxID=2768071 RepID=A0A7L7Z0P8_9MICO|nr:aromatic acid exporter family protein [Clavibacter zhangzhiyongii]QOD43294.1 FUSC family protein [Clavibacter zhangzhiyongii]
MVMSRVRDEIVRAWRAATSRGRLLLAAKTALAVGIAWAVAPFVPGVANEYPYYAPLGALVSMYPTLMGSARTGLQTLLGLAAGIVLATAVIATTGPSWWSIPVIVGIGVILSGSGWFGAGREYVPMAALFVLIIGGQDADTYSLGYLVQMAVGVVTGLLINVLVAPTLSSGQAAARISAFQVEVAQRLREVGDAVESDTPPAHDDWIRASEDLAGTARAVRADLAEADESRKGNPRALVNKRDVRIDHARLEAMDQIVFHVRDVSAALADTIWQERGALGLDHEVTGPIRDACHAVAGVLDLDDPDSPERHRAMGEAARRVRLLVEAVDRRSQELGRAMGPGVLTAMHLKRVLHHLEPVDAAESPAP